MAEESLIQELLAVLPQTGRVEWIGRSSGSRSVLEPVESIDVEVGTGLVGDHHSKRRPGGKRQVTLIQQEHLAAVGGLLHREPVRPDEARRNIVVSGINLLALKGRQFRIGAVVLEYTGPCEPCSRMEENLGPGGWNAMRGHGGITTRVITAGVIRVGDTVAVSP